MRLQVLVVDDEPMLLSVYRRWLERAGLAVLVATNGAEAVELLAAGGVDALVTDYSMPGMTGGDLIAATRAIWPGLPVVLLTSHPSPELHGGADPDVWLQKPTTAHTLLATIHEVIAMRAPAVSPCA